MKDVFIELDDCPSSPSELLWELAEARRQVARLEKEVHNLRQHPPASPPQQPCGLDEAGDPLGFFRGLFYGLGLSVILWVLLAFFARFIWG